MKRSGIMRRKKRTFSKIRLHRPKSMELRSYEETISKLPPLTPYAPLKTVAAIVSVQNEEDTIASVLLELEKLQLNELIIVINGCTDKSLNIGRQHSKAKIVYYPQSIGHDVGRAIGAKIATSDILLFVDGDFPVTSSSLSVFVNAVQQGVDVALNNITPFLPTFDRRDDLTQCKEFLNRCLGRHDLHANSLTAVPHALSRKAIETIGYKNLMVPPKAQSIAVLKGLRVEVCGCVNVIDSNKVRKSNVGKVNPVSQMIVGDHLEAIRQAMDISGQRLFLPDHSRKRIAARRNGV